MANSSWWAQFWAVLSGEHAYTAERAQGVELVPDETTDVELAAMREDGRIPVRRSEGPSDFDV